MKQLVIHFTKLSLKFFFTLALSFLILASASQAQNQSPVVYGYNYWAYQWIKEYQSELNKHVDQYGIHSYNQAGASTCSSMLQKAYNRGFIDIRYIFGYFDDSATGKDVIWEGINFGRSPSLDKPTFNGLRQILTEPCQGQLEACGFQQQGNPESGMVTLEKSIQLHGVKIPVRITLAYSSVSQSHIENTTSLVERQKNMTEQAERIFLDGLSRADIVFYNGHSRNGGGPDFRPPILDKTFHPNYNGYYKVKRPGISKVTSQLRTSPNPGLILGLFSCSSYSHFNSMLIKAAPKTRLILSSDLVDYRETLITSVGYLDGLLQGRCGEDLAQFAKRTKRLYDNFKGYNIR